MSDRDLGTMGEREFGKKCASVGITASSSKPDRNGWDSFLEIDQPEVQASRMLDKKPPQIKCLVQVKATDSLTKSNWDIKLSNLKKLVDFAGPAFFVLMRFSGEEDVQEIYLVHVDGSIARRVMKKLRQISLEKKDPAKISLTIPFGNHRLHEPTGACIKEQITGVVPDESIDKYIAAKQQIRETVGYEGGRHKVTFTPKDMDAAKALSEAMLGVPAEVPVINVIHQNDIRFDMPASIIKMDEAFVSLEAYPHTTVEVFFQGNDPHESITFSADVYTVPFLKTVRLDFKMFDLRFKLEPRSVDWNITHTDETICSLDLLHRFYSFISMAGSGTSLRVGIQMGDKIETFAEMTSVGSIANVFIDQKELSSYAKRILHHFSILDVPVTTALLNQQRLNLFIFAEALDGTLKPLTLTLPPLDDLNLELEKEYTTIFPIIVCLGNYLFCAILKMKGCFANNGDGYQCISRTLTILNTFNSPRKDIDGFCETRDQKLKEFADKEDMATTIAINRVNKEFEKALFLDVETK